MPSGALAISGEKGLPEVELACCPSGVIPQFEYSYQECKFGSAGALGSFLGQRHRTENDMDEVVTGKTIAPRRVDGRL